VHHWFRTPDPTQSSTDVSATLRGLRYRGAVPQTTDYSFGEAATACLLKTYCGIDMSEERSSSSATFLRRERLAARPALETIFADVHHKASRNEQVHQAVRVHEHTLKEEVARYLGLYCSTISVIAKRVTGERKHLE